MSTLSYIIKPSRNGNLQINARISHSGKITDKFTGYTIPAAKVNNEYKHWNPAKQRVINLPAKDSINSLLSNWQNAFIKYKDKCNAAKAVINIQAFKNTLQSKQLHTTEANIDLPPDVDLLYVTDQFIISCIGIHKLKTEQGYNTIRDNIAAYELSTGASIQLHQVDKEFYKRFGLWLISEHNNFNNSVNRKLSRIRTIMNFAFRKGYVKDQLYREIEKFKESTAARFAVQAHELAIIYKIKPKTDFQQQVLDAFILVCEVSLRFSDITQLKGVHVQDKYIGKQKITILDLSHEKTIFHNKVTLSERALKIIKKYSAARQPTEPLFTVRWSQASNEALKDMFEDAKLNRPCEITRTKGNETIRTIEPLYKAISFHMGRNTAITTQLSAGLPVAFVKDNVGIKSMRTLMNYYKDNEEDRWLATIAMQNKKK